MRLLIMVCSVGYGTKRGSHSDTIDSVHIMDFYAKEVGSETHALLRFKFGPQQDKFMEYPANSNTPLRLLTKIPKGVPKYCSLIPWGRDVLHRHIKAACEAHNRPDLKDIANEWERFFAIAPTTIQDLFVA